MQYIQYTNIQSVKSMVFVSFPRESWLESGRRSQIC